MEPRAKYLKRGKTQTISKLGFQTQRKFRQEEGSFKKDQPNGMLVGSPRECVSIVMKWDITPKIAPNPN
jgi:hypothetical protein